MHRQFWLLDRPAAFVGAVGKHAMQVTASLRASPTFAFFIPAPKPPHCYLTPTPRQGI
jgi:hypothetical protein